MPPLDLTDACPCGISRKDCSYHAPKYPLINGFASGKNDVSDPDTVRNIIFVWARNKGLPDPYAWASDQIMHGLGTKFYAKYYCKWRLADKCKLIDYLIPILDHDKITVEILD